jgi:hypoxanthine phosphoribosyltransferase
LFFSPLLQTLKGATIFASDLLRAIDPVPDGLEMGFVRASSYGAGTKSSGKVVLGISTIKDEDILGRHVLLVSYFALYSMHDFLVRQHKSL